MQFELGKELGRRANTESTRIGQRLITRLRQLSTALGRRAAGRRGFHDPREEKAFFAELERQRQTIHRQPWL